MLFKITRTNVRLAFWGSFVLFMVMVILPMFFFFYLFDEARVKQAIIDQFDNKTYDVAIYGGVIPKLWHGMSLDLSGVLLTSKDHQDLIRIRQMSCKLSWLDLIIGRYSVNRIAIAGLNINQNNLIHYGVTNLLNASNRKDKLFNIERLKITDIETVGTDVKFPINNGTLIVGQNGFGAQFSLGFNSNNGTFYSIIGEANGLTDNVIKFTSFNTHIYNIFSNINLSSSGFYQLNSKHLILDQINGDITIKNYVAALSVNKVDLGLDGANAQGMTLQVDFANGLITHHVLLNADKLSTVGYKSFVINKLQNQYRSDFTSIKFSADSKIENLVYTESQGIVSNSCSNQINFVAPNIKRGEFNAQLIGRCAYDPSNASFNFGLTGNFNNSPVELKLQLFNK
ncbi:MAG: hypothetical protein K2P99_01220 [Burkholderiales bacterium]|nr:hypothetical protein [Burkholderiales bacterium]